MKKFKVLFKRSNGRTKIIGYTGDETDLPIVDDCNPNLRNASKMINRYLSNYPNFKHYYTRIIGPINDSKLCAEGERMWEYDVGSWTECFYVIETTKNWRSRSKEEGYEKYSKELFTLATKTKEEEI